MNGFFVAGDILILIVCIVALYVAFRLWSLLGRKGITSWFMLAMIYAILLRTLSLLTDCGVTTGILTATKVLAFPMYVLLALGLWCLYRQVDEKLSGNGHLPLPPDIKKVVVHLDVVEVVTPDSIVKVKGKKVVLPVEKNGK
jgi:hypothetical protein